jgi:hypothetical protein
MISLLEECDGFSEVKLWKVLVQTFKNIPLRNISVEIFLENNGLQ